MRSITNRIKKGMCLCLTATLLSGCQTSLMGDGGVGSGSEGTALSKANSQTLEALATELTTEPLSYEVDPSTFSLEISKGQTRASVSLPGEERAVTEYKTEGQNTSWFYPEENISVSLEAKENYLKVRIKSDASAAAENIFEWPSVAGAAYYMPIGEGKRIPADNTVWQEYLAGQEFSVIEQLSMPFFAVDSGDCAVLYIMENPYRSDMIFDGEEGRTEKIAFSIRQQFPEIDTQKETSFRIYMTDNNPVIAAKLYRGYVIEQGRFVTLEQKADKNENIRKLYGAPHIYLWGENLISPEDINWPAFRAAADSGVFLRLKEFAAVTESGAEALTAFSEIENQDYVAEYQKNVICRYLSEVLRRVDFYNPSDFPVSDDKMNLYSSQGIQNLSETDLLQFNKHSLAANLPKAFQPAETWMDHGTVNLLSELKESGIDRAFIGLNSWEQAYAKPELVKQAVESDYLIGPYDSYHSIHKPGEEKWITAKFEDVSLYEAGTVLDKTGEKEAGFQNVGRKLNPTLSMPSVTQRTETIMSSGIDFNSWFIDCDATGEIYDDYTPGRMTTRQQDLKARLERMGYIRDQLGMIIGSEGGHDFAAADIAFAHGIELKSFSWMDEDMKKNKDSEFYIGGYYNPTGGVAAHFSKPIQVKEKYYTLFVDPRYDIPLYKLVYNDSVITTYHWDWSTFKIVDAVPDRMVRELLYNVPPLYHLDSKEWQLYKPSIEMHTGIWSEFSKKAILQEMTDFSYLLKDGSVQMSQYGDNLWVIGNFGDKPFMYDDGNEKTEIPPHSALIHMDKRFELYTPSAIS